MIESVSSACFPTSPITRLSIIRQARTLDAAVSALTLEKFKEVMNELYNIQGMSMEQMAQKLGKDYRTINRWIRTLGIKSRPNIAPLHTPKLVPQPWMEETKLCMVNGKPARMTSIYPTDDLSYFIGFAIGDGWVGSRGIELCNTEFGLLDHLLSIMNGIGAKYGGKIGLQYRDECGRNVTREEAYSFRIWLSNSNIARLIKQENQPRYDTLDFLLSAKAGHFMAGLWDADGCVSYHTRERLCIEVYVCQGEGNFKLLKRIADTLNKFGIKTSCQLSDEKHTSHNFHGKSYRLNENVYRLHVFKVSVENWIEVVGKFMKHPKKVEKINQIRRLIEIEDGHRRGPK